MAQASIQDYYQFGRAPAMIQLKDRDTMFFISDFLFGDATPDGTGGSMGLYSEDNSSARYLMDGVDIVGGTTDDSIDKYRILYYGRFAADTLAAPVRMVPCLTEDNTAIFPLIEVHQPQVSYEPISNVITLTFWTLFQDT